MLISKEEIKGMEVVAEGYKIFNDDWTANYGNNYSYLSEKGEVKGTIHRVSGELVRCGNGLHFCENPLDCMKFYPFTQWNKFAKVKGYGVIAKSSDNTKVAVEILEIVEILSWNEFLEEMKQVSKDTIMGEDSVANSEGISDGHGISDGYGIRNGSGISDGYGISGGHGIRNGYGIRNGHGISDGYGIESSSGVNSSYYCKKCEGVSNCIMCFDYTGKNSVFNKQIDDERVHTIKSDISKLAKDWYPKFNNAFDLHKQNGEKWECVPPHKIESKECKEAYADMPKKLVKYFEDLPEFDALIFEEITGIKG